MCMYAYNFELVYGLFLNLLKSSSCKTVIMLKVVVRSPLPASWIRLHADLSFPPAHIASGWFGWGHWEPLEETWPVSKKHICAGCSTARFFRGDTKRNL